MALNLNKDDWRVLGHARLWYVPVRYEGSLGSDKIVSLASSQTASQSGVTASREGQESYESMKRVLQDMKSREHLRQNLTPLTDFITSVKPDSVTRVNNSVQMVRPGPSSLSTKSGESMEELCENGSGVILRLMDEAGCTGATNHSHHHCISTSIRSTVLLQQIHPGSRLIAKAWPIFSSSRSLEVKVEIDEQRKDRDGVTEVRERVAEGIVTCQALDEYLQPMSMPEFKPATDEETKVFTDRQRLHEERKETLVGDKTQTNKTHDTRFKLHSFNVGL